MNEILPPYKAILLPQKFSNYYLKRRKKPSIRFSFISSPNFESATVCQSTRISKSSRQSKNAQNPPSLVWGCDNLCRKITREGGQVRSSLTRHRVGKRSQEDKYPFAEDRFERVSPDEKSRLSYSSESTLLFQRMSRISSNVFTNLRSSATLSFSGQPRSWSFHDYDRARAYVCDGAKGGRSSFFFPELRFEFERVEFISRANALVYSPAAAFDCFDYPLTLFFPSLRPPPTRRAPLFLPRAPDSPLRDVASTRADSALHATHPPSHPSSPSPVVGEL